MATVFKRSNGIYYYVTYSKGRRVWRSTGTRSKVEARNVLAAKSITKLTDPKLIESAGLTLSNFMPQFLEYARANYAPTTVLLYQGIVNSFIRIMGDFSIKAYTITDVEEFKAKRLKEVSPVKVNIDFRTMRALFQTACRWKMIDENPFHNVKQIKVPLERPTYISRENFNRLLNSMNIPWFKNLVIFAVCTMMRCGEIVSLTWDNIDLKRRVIFIENSHYCPVKSRINTIGYGDCSFHLSYSFC